MTVENLDNGCQTSETITVALSLNTPNVIAELISGMLAPIDCSNPELVYEGQLINPDPNVSIEWTDPNGTIIPGNTVVLNEFSIQGTYTLTAFDNTNGCFSFGSVTPLWDFDDPVIALSSSAVIDCFPDAEVSLMAIDSTLNNNTSFTWTDPQGGQLMEGLSNPTVTMPGIYTCVATGQNGCTSIDQIEVVAVEDITFEQNIISVTCFGEADASVELNVLTGVPPFDVSGDLDALSNDNLASGIYMVSIVDVNGCSATSEIVILEPDQLLLSQNEISTNGVLEVNASGGTPEYTYLWNDGTMGNTISEAVSGFAYEVTVTDANGCIGSLNMVLTNTTELTIDSNDVSLFPNPSKGQFQVLYEPTLDLNEILIYNIYGQVVYQMKNEFSTSRIDFSLPELSQGTYLFEARFGQGVHRQKIILL